MTLSPIKIKLTLRQFRKRLKIPSTEVAAMGYELVRYLVQHRLIDTSRPDGIYAITPRGYVWDVDYQCVRQPDPAEDIMDRDQEVEPQLVQDPPPRP